MACALAVMFKMKCNWTACTLFSLLSILGGMALSSSLHSRWPSPPGREEGGRVGVGGEGDINSAECLGNFPSKDGACVILSNHAGWLWIWSGLFAHALVHYTYSTCKQSK